MKENKFIPLTPDEVVCVEFWKRPTYMSDIKVLRSSFNVELYEQIKKSKKWNIKNF